MLLQRDQLTERGRHIKTYHVDEIECVRFNLEDFGLARAADDLVYTLAGPRPNLSPWKSYWAMGLCPDPQRKAVYSTVLQMGLMWFSCDFFMIRFKISFFIISWIGWPAALVFDQTEISLNSTSGFRFCSLLHIFLKLKHFFLYPNLVLMIKSYLEFPQVAVNLICQPLNPAPVLPPVLFTLSDKSFKFTSSSQTLSSLDHKVVLI